jgi:hypothetical protein
MAWLLPLPSVANSKPAFPPAASHESASHTSTSDACTIKHAECCLCLRMCPLPNDWQLLLAWPRCCMSPHRGALAPSNQAILWDVTPPLPASLILTRTNRQIETKPSSNAGCEPPAQRNLSTSTHKLSAGCQLSTSHAHTNPVRQHLTTPTLHGLDWVCNHAS